MTRPTSSQQADRERGAVLVHVVFAFLALIAFTTFVVDYGVFWTARRQAQNSADAGALAGAIAFTYDDPGDFSDSGMGKVGAWEATQANLIYGQAPNVNITSDITYPACPDGNGTCIRVDVYRDPSRGNPLPIFFGTLVGLTQQGVKATATAQVRTGNATNCLKPWAIPDKWQENQTGPWTVDDTFDRYDKDGNLRTDITPDVYTPPTSSDPGTSYTLANDHGTEMVLKTGDPHDTIRAGWFSPVVLTGTGGSDYRDNIGTCVGTTYKIGDLLTVEPGNMVGPTSQGVGDLIALDPGADWDDTNDVITGGCMQAGTCSISPRVVAIPVYDLEQYLLSKMAGREEIIIRNFLGFFIDRMDGNDVVGYLITNPTIFDESGPSVDDSAAFSVVIRLVR